MDVWKYSYVHIDMRIYEIIHMCPRKYETKYNVYIDVMKTCI